MTEEVKNLLNISWTEFDFQCAVLLKSLKDVALDIDCIVAIARGGLVPAAVIANALNVRDVRSIAVSSYSEGVQIQEPAFLVDSSTRYIFNNRSVLFVDDIVDSGKTHRAFDSIFPAAYFASIYVRHTSQSFPDFYSVCIPSNDWVVFPWEPKRT